jgi:transcription initiation factor TFIIE subunit alpha
MDAAKTLIRTAVRSFYSNPKQILIIDALLIHSVLHAEDLNILLATQTKEIRKLVAQLKGAQLLDTHSKVEAKLGQSRGTSRDYYYIPFHAAVDAIKYRITKLTDKVKEKYQPESARKDWRCPRCKSEYDTFQVLPYATDDGFACEKCGTMLEETPQAKDAAGMVGHEKHSLLMDQLAKILGLMQQVDRLQVPENDFETAWERRKEVPRGHGQHARKEYVPVPGGIRVAKAGRTGPEQVKAEALGVLLTSGEEHDKADAERREAKKAELARQNMLPIWHTSSAVAGAASNSGQGDVKAEDGLVKGEGVLKKEEEDDITEKKPIIDNDDEEQDELAVYRAEMAREREEEARRAAMEDLESEDEEDDDGFEDVISTGVGTPQNGIGTPSGSQQHHLQQIPRSNGVKREFDSESGPSSDANTPAAVVTPSASVSESVSAAVSVNDGSEREAKRVKFGDDADSGAGVNRGSGATAAVKKGESEDDEEDFEDAM